MQLGSCHSSQNHMEHFLTQSGRGDAMRIAGLIVVAFCFAASVVLALAESAQSSPLCLPVLTLSSGGQRDTVVKEPKMRSRLAKLCRSPARSHGTLPTCNSGPSITCRGSCSNGAEWFSWQCCIGQDGFPPVCSLNCNKQFAGCVDQ